MSDHRFPVIQWPAAAMLILIVVTASTARAQANAVFAAAKQVQGLIDRLADTGSINENQLGLAWHALNEAEYRLPPEIKASVSGGGPATGYIACHVMLANASVWARQRLAQRAHQEAQAAIQCYANALGIGSQQPPVDAPTVVFNYYYINGINTPLDGPGRGNYRWDSRMIRGNLLDQGPQVGFNQRPRQPSDLTVATTKERTVFQENGEETYNFSGTQPLYTQAGFCKSLRTGKIALGLGDRQVADLFCWLDSSRASGLGGMSPGDVLESFLQSNASTLSFASEQPDVIKWAGMIRSKFENEQRQAASREKNFFILIAHSQGNFFAEGVAYRLAFYEGNSGRNVFMHRLGVLSLASPTNYNSLNSLSADFVTRRIKHFTRHDDGIQALHALAPLGKKVPWDRAKDLPSLWPWNDVILNLRTKLVVSCAQLPIPLCSPFLDTMGLGPDTQCKPVNNPRCDHALYTPLMNSHLLDNYLTDPTLTMPNRPINEEIAKDLALSNPVSPASPPVLTEVRSGLRELKGELLNGSRNE